MDVNRCIQNGVTKYGVHIVDMIHGCKIEPYKVIVTLSHYIQYSAKADCFHRQGIRSYHLPASLDSRRYLSPGMLTASSSTGPLNSENNAQAKPEPLPIDVQFLFIFEVEEIRPPASLVRAKLYVHTVYGVQSRRIMKNPCRLDGACRGSTLPRKL